MTQFLPSYAFLMAVAFWPNIAGAATSPRWAVASLAGYWLSPWFLPFIAYCYWLLDFDSATHWTIACAVLSLGFAATDRQREVAIRAFCLGIGVSSVVAAFQTAGWQGIAQIAPPAGLFLNKNVMGETAALAFAVALGLKGKDRWYSIAFVIPAIVLSGGRAAWLGTGCALLLWLPWRFSSALLALAGLLIFWEWSSVSGSHVASLLQRFYLWRGAMEHLTWLGNGPYDFSTLAWREDNLHNDWLQFVYELGVVGIAAAAFVLSCSAKVGRPFVAALAVISSFSFPLHVPASLWLVSFVAGGGLRLLYDESRSPLRRRSSEPRLRRTGQRA